MVSLPTRQIVSLAHAAGLLAVLIVVGPPAVLLAIAGYSYFLLFGGAGSATDYLAVGVFAAYVAILILAPLYSGRAYFQRRYRLAWLLMLAPVPPAALIWVGLQPPPG